MPYIDDVLICILLERIYPQEVPTEKLDEKSLSVESKFN